jgi:hypothetical protein
MLSARVMLVVGLLATTLALPSRAADKLTSNPKLTHRQIGGGLTMGLEAARRDKTFFLCGPDKVSCVSATAIGWRKPFIMIRTRGWAPYCVYDTSAEKYIYSFAHESALPSYLKNIPLEPTAVAWEKLSPTRRLW